MCQTEVQHSSGADTPRMSGVRNTPTGFDWGKVKYSHGRPPNYTKRLLPIPIAQRIEHRFPKPQIEVRFLLGVQTFKHSQTWQTTPIEKAKKAG